MKVIAWLGIILMVFPALAAIGYAVYEIVQMNSFMGIGFISILSGMMLIIGVGIADTKHPVSCRHIVIPPPPKPIKPIKPTKPEEEA